MLDLTPLQWAQLALFVPLLSAAVLGVVWPLRKAGGPAAGVSLVGAIAIARTRDHAPPGERTHRPGRRVLPKVNRKGGAA